MLLQPSIGLRYPILPRPCLMPFPRGRLKEHSSAFAMLQRGVDLLLMVAAAMFAAWLRYGSVRLSQEQATTVVIALLMASLAFSQLGLYRSWRAGSIAREISLLWAAWGGVFLLLTGLLFALKIGADYSRLWVASWFSLAAALLALGRGALRLGLRWLRARGYNERMVCLVGDGETARSLRDLMGAGARLGFRMVAWYGVHEPPPRDMAPRSGLLGELASFVAASPVDEVWVAMPLRDEDGLRAAFDALRHSTANVRYVPDRFGYELLQHAATRIGSVTMLDLSVSPMEGLNRLLKRTEDLLLGTLFLLLASPLMALIALAIKLDSPGPVLFRQRRIGWSGKEFVIYKFRTMREHPVPVAGQLPQATREDPRITRLGRWLRRSSLDELPQLINVLQGRMSLVGPRPHAVEHHHLYIDRIPSYAARHMVKPGITGYAQVEGFRGETETAEKMARRVEYDMLYIQQWSIALDLKLILLTLLKGLVHRNAY